MAIKYNSSLRVIMVMRIYILKILIITCILPQINQ